MNVDSVVPELLGMAIRACGIFLIAAIALRVFRVRSAAVQHAVWTMVLAGMALLALSPALPPIEARILPPAEPRAGIEAAAPQGVKRKKKDPSPKVRIDGPSVNSIARRTASSSIGDNRAGFVAPCG